MAFYEAEIASENIGAELYFDQEAEEYRLVLPTDDGTAILVFTTLDDVAQLHEKIGEAIATPTDDVVACDECLNEAAAIVQCGPERLN